MADKDAKKRPVDITSPLSPTQQKIRNNKAETLEQDPLAKKYNLGRIDTVDELQGKANNPGRVDTPGELFNRGKKTPAPKPQAGTQPEDDKENKASSKNSPFKTTPSPFNR